MSWQWPTSGGIGNQGRSKPNCRHLRERWNNTTLEGQVVGAPPGILHPLPAPDPLHAPGDGGWRSLATSLVMPGPYHPGTLLGL